jgi:hypothetical protein
MKNNLLILFLMLATFVGFGQASPPEKADGEVDGVSVSIKYSSPRVKGRTIYGDLVPYDKVWRAGANENTTIEFSDNVKIGGKDLEKGKYGFFIIPKENGEWIAIFNKKNDAWGSMSYDKADDALRVNVDAKFDKDGKENLAFRVKDKGIKFMWADKSFEMNITK